MTHAPTARIALGALLALALPCSSPALAQCAAAWGSMGGMSGADAATTSVGALTLWDPDGPGPAPAVLVAGGIFTAAGATPASNIASWDGQVWAPLGAGLDGAVNALAVLPDGRLVAAGAFAAAGAAPASNIAVWNGAAWSPLGAGVDGEVWALAVSGAGELFAGGLFSSAGAVACNHIARWNGTAWAPLGSSAQNGVNSAVYALAFRPNNELVVGGAFTSAGGSLYRYIARWNGSAWLPAGASISSAVLALAVAPGGDVFAGGLFSAGGAGRIARWNGSTWSTLGAGLNMQPLTLSVQEDGAVIAGGWFSAAGGAPANKIARWDGSAWSTFGAGVDSYVIAQAVLPSGDLVIGGGFSLAGGVSAPAIARWSVPATFSITHQPVSAAPCIGGSADFSVTTSGSAATYQWQARLDPGVWSDLTDGPLTHAAAPGCTISGAASSTLHVSAMHALAAPIELRCLLADACTSSYSAAATLRACPADFDCSGALAVPDIFAFLGAWFAADPMADINASGSLSVQDIFDFLAAWFTGC